MNKKIKVSFDFDGTLSKKSVQKYARSLVKKGIDVWIVTRRFDAIDKYSDEFCKKYSIGNIRKEFLKLYRIAKYVGVKHNHIVYTNMEPKNAFFSENPNFVFHVDDDPEDIVKVAQTDKVVAVPFIEGNSDWKKACDTLLDIYKFNNQL